MKIEALAMAVAFVAGTMASPKHMEATSVNAQRYTAKQLSAMSDQQAQTLCKLKAHICCHFKRDLQSTEALERIQGTEQFENAEAAATLCKICVAHHLVDCEDHHRCDEDDDRPECGPQPCRGRHCATEPGHVDPPPCQEDDERPECGPPPCRGRHCFVEPGHVDPPPCQEDDERPECGPPPCRGRHCVVEPGHVDPPPCQENDSRPECSGGAGPYPG